MKTKICCLIWLYSFITYGQIVTIKDHYPLTLESKTKAYYPKLNPSGDLLLFSCVDYKGLQVFNLQTQIARSISSLDGSGLYPEFLPEGKGIVYTSLQKQQRDNYRSLVEYNFKKGAEEFLSQPLRSQREINQIMNSKVRNSASVKVQVREENLKIVVYEGGKRRELAPISDALGYLWPSLSPDGSKILFTAINKGTYICDLSGKLLSYVGFLNAPVWYDDRYVVAMKDRYDGYDIVTSKIVIASTDGKQVQSLTPPNSIAMYPTSCSAKSLVAYNTKDGQIFMIKIEKNQ